MDTGASAAKRRPASSVEQAGGQQALGAQMPQLPPMAMVPAEALLVSVINPQGLSARQEEQGPSGGGLVDLHMGKNPIEGREQGAQQLGVEKPHAHPLHEDPGGCQAMLDQLEKFACEQVRGTGGPRVRRLGHDGVE